MTSNTSRTRKNGPVSLIKADPAELAGPSLPDSVLARLKAAAAAAKAAKPAPRVSRQRVKLTGSQGAALAFVGWAAPYVGDCATFEPVKVSAKFSKYAPIADGIAQIITSGETLHVCDLAQFVAAEVEGETYRSLPYILQTVANRHQIKVNLSEVTIKLG